ncbi:hypothetical protein M3G43_02720 [Brevibacterium casei]|uniref:hypothetical protein n=1 Tax=Brevibacterium casei TaxID=33889 RepID=UPI00223B8DA0|nr:hypothetical protein [Brevibacterium casei]MCT1446177.1 hypothetical protein [Brevibacterium casei]
MKNRTDRGFASQLNDLPYLLPTPRTTDAGGPGIHGNGGQDLRTEVSLLPTPDAYAGTRGGTQAPEKRRAGGHAVSVADVAEHELLPTPKAGDADFGLTRTTGRPPERSTHLATRLHYTDFGKYAPAIERWEAVMDRPSPAPTETTKQGKQRLAALFVEFLMGLDDGWVTDPELDLSRVQQLRILGNGVVTLQAVYALSWLIDRAHITLRRTA